MLDLKSERGREIVLDLVRHVTCLLENFGPAHGNNGGWVPNDTRTGEPDHRDHPNSAFGQTGPTVGKAGLRPPWPRHSAASASGWRS